MTIVRSWDLYYQNAGRDAYYELAARYLFSRRYVAQRAVLDTACHTGHGVASLAERARMVMGIDSRQNAVAYCQQRWRLPNVRFVQMDWAELGFRDHTFDVITAFETLEYVKDTERFFKELRRVLRPGGRLFISIPNRSLSIVRNRGRANPHWTVQLDEIEFHDLLSKYFVVESMLGQQYFSSTDIPQFQKYSSRPLQAGSDGYVRRALRVLFRTALPGPAVTRFLLRAQIWANKSSVGDVQPDHAINLIASVAKR